MTNQPLSYTGRCGVLVAMAQPFPYFPGMSAIHLKATTGDPEAVRRVAEAYARMCYMGCTDAERVIIADAYQAGWLGAPNPGKRERDYTTGRQDAAGWATRRIEP